ncbi:MAG: Fe(3+) ABC transporter substrate-binding protein [Bacteroidia bacterium]|nr:Fe(3+) ABC transporter substrate-binding protein [Bacteroidia bacterium]
MNSQQLYPLVLISALLIWGGCQPSATTQAVPQEVNVYTHRHYDTDDALFRNFEAKTGIRVNVIKGGEDELLNRLETEGAQSPADVLITVDAGRLYRAQEKGLLQAVSSPVLQAQVPAHLRDPEGHWYGLTQRARVIVYHKTRVAPGAVKSYDDLADPVWKGKVLVRAAENLYNQSLMAALIEHKGDSGALVWAQGVVANMARDPKGNDRDQIKAVSAGAGDLALVNTYYIGLLLNSIMPEEREAAQAVGIVFPEQESQGTHVNISGAGVARYAPHRENAVKLIEFLTAAEAQGTFASRNYEYPVNPAVPPAELLQSWGTFKADTLQLRVLGQRNRQATDIFAQAGWK